MGESASHFKKAWLSDLNHAEMRHFTSYSWHCNIGVKVLFGRSTGNRTMEHLAYDFDVAKSTISGYQGLLKLHQNSRIPYKKSKNHPLTAEQKLWNCELSRERIVIENINAKIKTFKIMSERYRNRRKKHQRRMNLVCAILNPELVA